MIVIGLDRKVKDGVVTLDLGSPAWNSMIIPREEILSEFWWDWLGSIANDFSVTERPKEKTFQETAQDIMKAFNIE